MVKKLPEVIISSSDMSWNKTGSWRYLRPHYENKTPPCSAGCPAGTDIEGCLRLLAEGKIDRAMALIKMENPLPRICGRVCFHPCEIVCNRGEYDRPIAINTLERFIAEVITKRTPKIRKPKIRRQERVAVIGAGPAGLSCAYHLTRLGYPVEVFEAFPQAGGMLRVGIPAFRLPREVLDAEVGEMLAMGIEIKTGVRLGDNLSWRDLKGFKAIFLGTGAHVSRNLAIPGEDFPGVYRGLEFLARLNNGEKISLGKRVAIIGGGNTAIDAARSVLRLHSEPHILYRRTRREMPAFGEEIIEAEREGIEFSFLTAPTRILTHANRVKGIECMRMMLGEPDESGRRRPIPVKDSNFIIEVDNVVAALGEEADLSYLDRDIKIVRGLITTDTWQRTSKIRVFAGGDNTSLQRTVIDAIAAGKKAALAIDCFIQERDLEAMWPEMLIGTNGVFSMQQYLNTKGRPKAHSPGVVTFSQLNPDYFAPAERIKRPALALEERQYNFTEVNKTIPKEVACREAERCFHCGVCNNCENCYLYCPEGAIYPQKTTPGYQIDYDYCKGCGVCVEECPRNALALEEEER
jgi:2-oxoacid:acceptor oxidoreductase delta subunit (pyruvate/2-ketoisovalerate family)